MSTFMHTVLMSVITFKMQVNKKSIYLMIYNCTDNWPPHCLLQTPSISSDRSWSDFTPVAFSSLRHKGELCIHSTPSFLCSTSTAFTLAVVQQVFYILANVSALILSTDCTSMECMSHISLPQDNHWMFMVIIISLLVALYMHVCKRFIA